MIIIIMLKYLHFYNATFALKIILIHLVFECKTLAFSKKNFFWLLKALGSWMLYKTLLHEDYLGQKCLSYLSY